MEVSTNTTKSDNSINKKVNPFNEVYLQKLCLNINVKPKAGGIDKAVQVLRDLTGQEPKVSKSKLTIRGWGVKRSDKIAASVTIKGPKAMKLLGDVIKVKDNELPASCFSRDGNFGTGIEEHIDLGIKYNPSIGIFGVFFYAVLKKRGDRVSKRRRHRQRIGNKQRVTTEEGHEWFRNNFNGILKK